MSLERGARSAGELVFMRELAPDQREHLSSLGVARSYRRGSAIWHEGQMGDRVLIVQSGCVKLSRYTDSREVVLAIGGPGDLLGELAAIEPRSRTASAVALEDVEAIVVPPADFAAFIERHPEVTMLLLRIVAGRLADASVKQVETSVQDTLTRVAKRILELAERFGEEREGEISIDLPLSQEELAAW